MPNVGGQAGETWAAGQHRQGRIGQPVGHLLSARSYIRVSAGQVAASGGSIRVRLCCSDLLARPSPSKAS